MIGIMLILIIVSVNVKGENNNKQQSITESTPVKTETITYYNVPLSYELQDYIRETCEEFNVDMKTILAIMKTESDFKHESKSKNNIGNGYSVGICQLNQNHIRWYAKLTSIRDFDINNIHHNIRAGVAIFKYYRNYWEQKVDSDKLEIYTLNSYNMGIQGFKTYIKKYKNISRSYDKKVFKARDEIECVKVTIIKD